MVVDSFILRELVQRVRTECPTFEDRVGPAADYNNVLLEDTSIPVPHCTIVPMVQTAYPKEVGVYEQNERQTYCLYVVIDNKPRRLDGEDLAPYDVLSTIHSELKAALLNWKPGEQENGLDEMILSSGYKYKETEARLWWEFRFTTATYLWSVSNISPCSIAQNLQDIDTIFYHVMEPDESDGTVPAEDYLELPHCGED